MKGGAAVNRVRRLVSRALTVGRSRPARWFFGLAAAALAVWAVVTEWDAVRDALSRLDGRTLALAVLATGANLVLTGLLWRAVLADLGSRLPVRTAARIFFVGQLGKYLPGSLWPVIMQAELGRDHGVPRRRTVTAMVATLLVSITSAAVIVLFTLLFAPDVLPDGFGWVFVLAVPMAVLLHPAVLARLMDAGLHLAGREPLERRTTALGTLVAAAWALASWIFAGLQVAVLAVGLGAPADTGTLVLCIGGYALAWAVGFLFVVAPAGAGAREVALAAVLSPLLDRGEVVVVVLLSRVLFTLADLIAAGAGVMSGRSAQRGAQAAFGSGESAAG